MAGLLPLLLLLLLARHKVGEDLADHFRGWTELARRGGGTVGARCVLANSGQGQQNHEWVKPDMEQSGG